MTRGAADGMMTGKDLGEADMSERELCVGVQGQAQTTVDETNVASAVGSGLLPVFGTPSLVALMEQAACGALLGRLSDGETTVGAEIAIRHTAPTPIGEVVTATATLTAVEGRKLTFSCVAFDACGQVGDCTQTRFIVEKDRFLGKMQSKRG